MASAKRANTLSVEKRADVAAYFVDVVGLIEGQDFEEHGFEAHQCRRRWCLVIFVFDSYNDRGLLWVGVA